MAVFLLPRAALMTAERFCAAAVLGRERIRTLTRATTPSTLPLRSVCLEEVACKLVHIVPYYFALEHARATCHDITAIH